MAAHTITHNKKPAEASTPGGLNLVFSTTHPLQKESVHASYHDSSARVYQNTPATPVATREKSGRFGRPVPAPFAGAAL